MLLRSLSYRDLDLCPDMTLQAVFNPEACDAAAAKRV
jgi:hypothetical protein